MDIERLNRIVLADLKLDVLKFENDLEVSINKDNDIDIKLKEIKLLLSHIIMTENMIIKYESLMSNIK